MNAVGIGVCTVMVDTFAWHTDMQHHAEKSGAKCVFSRKISVSLFIETNTDCLVAVCQPLIKLLLTYLLTYFT